MENDNEKDFLFNQENTIDEKSIKLKIYKIFYFLIKNQKGIHLLTLIILTILEMIQLISYAFSEPHINTWNFKTSTKKNISLILSAIRIAPLMKLLHYYNFVIILIIIIVYIIIITILFLTQLLFGKINSKIFILFIYYIQITFNPTFIFAYIPFTELMLIPLKCTNGNNYFFKEVVKCHTGEYFLYLIFGVCGAIIFFCILLFILIFNFSPFLYESSTIRINSSNDIFLLITKLIIILRFLFIENEYLSITILLLLSLYLLLSEFNEETYSNNVLEIIVNIRNSFVFWTYLMLLIAKFAENTKFKKLYILLIFGYPIITFLTIIKFKLKESDLHHIFGAPYNANNYLNKSRLLIKLIDSFVDNGKNIKYGAEIKDQKNDILIQGIIKIHTQKCINEECPLTKFIKNQGNFIIQKQCLLNFMTIHFNNGIKYFPSNSKIKIYFIQFNFSHRFNLNGVRTHLNELRKTKTTINIEFIIFCLEQEIKKMETKSADINDNNDDEFEIDLLEQKYRRLKFLIENMTKLYVEFWGIFAVNITNNLNSGKLYTIGEKLNKYLNEIKYLWENELKDKKIDISHQSVVQLYSRFLQEILWDQKGSLEITKKINEGRHNHYEIKKVDDEKYQLNNLDSLIENQEYLIFANTNEKGKCNIVQCTKNISYLLGYEKNEIIGKPVEFLMPTFFIDGHMKMLEERIKIISLEKNKEKDSFRDTNKKLIFIPIKNKMGYIVPLNAKFTLYDDNDYSNSFVIKAKLESRDIKSLYPYYIITKNDFTVDSISSAAINLGLTMDLLKKHVIKINLLIRGKKSELINLFETYNNYKEEPKTIQWIFPYLIYPKDNIKRNMGDNLNELIEKSPKQLFNLQIDIFKYNEDEIMGFAFKFIEVSKKYSNKIITEKYLPTKRQEFLFDLLTLRYIRTIIVDKKSGFRNLRDDNFSEENDSPRRKISSIKKEKRKKNYENEDLNAIPESSSEEENKKNILTKDKILELQTRDSNEIKQFIFSLPFHGLDISLEKFRPNKEKYPVGKSAEPSIKIQLSNFIKKIDKRVKLNSNSKNINKNENNDNINNNKNNFYDSNNNYLNQPSQVNDISKNEDTNKEILNDINTSLSKFFQEKSISYISTMSFCIFIFVCFFATLEFCLNYKQVKAIKSKISYIENAYKFLNDILYTKYFVTESVITNELENRINASYLYVDSFLYLSNKTLYNNEIKSELATIRQEMTEISNIFTGNSNNFPKDFKKYMIETNLKIETKSGIDTIQLNNALNRLTTHIFYVSTVTEGNFEINLSNGNTYELMKNLLNDYYTSWKGATVILVNDAKKNSVQSHSSLIILILSLIISILFLVLFWKLIRAFSLSREKPIILILTIKKKIFENLKNSAENFSNKLLNKFFGNEEIEEESQQDYQTNIQMNDVNIVKFKSSNTSINKDNSYFFLFTHLLLFFILVEIYFIAKYIFVNINYSNLFQYIGVYNTTVYSHTFTVASVDIEKSYFLNKTLPIMSKSENTKKILFDLFYNITEHIKDNQIQTSITNCFLRSKYVDKFEKLYYKNYSEVITNVVYITDSFSSLIANGIKPIIIRIFEILRYLILLYCQDINKYDEMNTITLINDFKFVDLNFSFQHFLRDWYNGVCKILSQELENYINNIKLIHIIIYIVLIFLVTLYYTFFWKNYLEKLESLLKKSRDLVNLIPEEIKYIIITKLNE